MKSILLIALLTFSTFTNAAVINGTSGSATFLNLGESQLDVANQLEWLNFSNLGNGDNAFKTMGYSINAVDAQFGIGSGYGFRIADEFEIASLFTTVFGTFFDGGTNGKMSFTETGGTSEIIQRRNSWLSGLGTDGDNTDTGTSITSNIAGETVLTITGGSLSSRGLYIDTNGNIQYAGVLLNVDTATTNIYGPDFQTGLTFDANLGYGNMGVFMVRDYIPTVPVPAAVWLFGSGLLGLVAVARRRS